MNVLNPHYREKLFQAINSSQFPSHLRMRIVDIDHKTSTFTMPAEPFRMQPFGVMHGGNIATLIDSATFWACFLAMGNDEDGLTSVDLKLNYLAAARNEAIQCKATMKKAGKTLFYADAEVETEDGRLIAHGSSTLMRIPGAGLKLGIPMFV
ncbi:MAG: PaaI family thioesterase [Bacillota bacterium]